MVPNGWKKTHLKEILSQDIRNGYSPIAANKETGYWVLSLGALTDSKIDPSEIKPVTKNERVIASLLKEGDFLVSRSNTPDKVGRSCLFRGEINNCSYPDLMMKFRPNADVAYPEYLEKLLQSNPIRTYFTTCATGSSSTMVKINKSVLEKTPLLLPPLDEQQKIAKTLSTWDKAIETTEKLINNSQAQKRALMQQLLTGKKRLLDENGELFRGKWESKNLGSIAKITTGSSNRQDSLDEGLYAFFDRSSEIRRSNQYLFDDEAIIVAGEGQEFVPKYFIGKFDLHQRTYAIIKTMAEYDYKFLYYLITFNNHYFLSQAVGSTVKSLRLPMFEKMPLKIPQLPEQGKIAKVLSNADREIESLQAKIEHIKQEKKALMQQLLTGKRRVTIN